MSWYVRPQARDAVIASGQTGAREFHRGFPGYAVTPLRDLPDLASTLGVGRVVVKDESQRMGLPSFKILGASWAVACLAAAHGDTLADLSSLKGTPSTARLHLVAATDGNHGRAVAHMAHVLGASSTIFLPARMSEPIAEAIAAEGADIVRVEGDYDEAVRQAADFAVDDPDRQLVQDMAVSEGDTVPQLIVDGYLTMLAEVDEQLGSAPGLVVVPVGVGSLAEAVVRHYRTTDGPRPHILAVEPDGAACLLASLDAGRPTTVLTSGTVMNGLDCGSVSTSAWPVLSEGLDAAVAVSDDQARAAVEELHAAGIRAGASGAATLAGARAVLGDPERRAALGLAPDATVVLLVTDGAIDAPDAGRPEAGRPEAG